MYVCVLVSLAVISMPDTPLSTLGPLLESDMDLTSIWVVSKSPILKIPLQPRSFPVCLSLMAF